MTFFSVNFLAILTNLLISGVQLLADPNMLNATEGERWQVCVTIQDDDPSRERSVGISFGLYPMGKCMTLYTLTKLALTQIIICKHLKHL